METKIAKKFAPIHFIGIGGIGMSGIAEVLVTIGYQVQGSDIKENANTKRLRSLGIKVFIGHDSNNLNEVKLVVVSSAITPANVELTAARIKGLPIVKRAEMLAELMRFKSTIAIGGSHGKTTTTSLLARVFESGGKDPTVINGGIINAYGTNVRLGAGEWMIVEADESDGSFVRLPSDVVVVTNIDYEHTDYYPDIDSLYDAFRQFADSIPFYGFAVVCIDNPLARKLAAEIKDRRIITYGESEKADYRLCDFKASGETVTFSVVCPPDPGSGYDPSSRFDSGKQLITDIKLAMIGHHNALNVTAVVAVADQLGIDHDIIANTFADFKGVKRRFSRVGEFNGVAIYDDYAHHPVEITSVLLSARQALNPARIIAVVQPHRYSRLATLFDDFAASLMNADKIIIMPVYGAGEEINIECDSKTLARAIGVMGHDDVHDVASDKEVVALIGDTLSDGDVIIMLGAGDITQLSHSLAGDLKKYQGNDGSKYDVIAAKRV